MPMHIFFQQNLPLTFGRAMLLKSEFDILDFPYSVIKIDMTSHLRNSDINCISILLNEMSFILSFALNDENTAHYGNTSVQKLHQVCT